MKTILVALMVYVATKISHLNTGEFHENIFPKIVDGVLESILIWPILYVRTGNFFKWEIQLSESANLLVLKSWSKYCVLEKLSVFEGFRVVIKNVDDDDNKAMKSRFFSSSLQN